MDIEWMCVFPNTYIHTSTVYTIHFLKTYSSRMTILSLALIDYTNSDSTMDGRATLTPIDIQKKLYIEC